jgi:peptide deformylase
MAVREVVKMGNPILRETATLIESKDILSNETKDLLQDMYDTMVATGGIGIAAPQIGVSISATIIMLPSDSERYPETEESKLFTIFNPEIEIVDQSLQGFWEGCLSVPGLRGYVERPKKVKIKYLDENAQPKELVVEDFLATVFQHELDHLFGKLYIDQIKDLTKLSYEEEYQSFWLPKED